MLLLVMKDEKANDQTSRSAEQELARMPTWTVVSWVMSAQKSVAGAA